MNSRNYYAEVSDWSAIIYQPSHWLASAEEFHWFSSSKPFSKILKVITVIRSFITYRYRHKSQVFFRFNLKAIGPRVSAKRTPSGGIRIFTHHALDFSPLIPNWYLKNVYDLIGLKFSSSSAETLHCDVQERKKRENNFRFSSTSMQTFSINLKQEKFGFLRQMVNHDEIRHFCFQKSRTGGIFSS